MAFIQPCFIRKNTPELRKKIEELGYKMNLIYSPNEQNLYIGGGVYSSANFIDNYYLDCGANEELFLALAALRDDSDYMQWFVTEKDEWVKCERKYFYQEPLTKTWRTWHKATVEEIIEYFKDK